MKSLLNYLSTWPTIKQLAAKFNITQDEAMKVSNAFLILENFAKRNKEKLNA